MVLLQILFWSSLINNNYRRLALADKYKQERLRLQIDIARLLDYEQKQLTIKASPEAVAGPEEYTEQVQGVTPA